MRRLLSGSLAALLILTLCAMPVLAAQNEVTPSPGASPMPATTAELFLLSEEQVPDRLVVLQEGERTLEDVASGFSDPEAAAEQFTEWGWQRNVIRAFHLPDEADGDPREIDGIYMSVHEFDSAESAAAALDYSFEAHASGTELEELPDTCIGEHSRALYGRLPYGNEITLYVQQGNVLIRLSAASPEGNLGEEATELMRTVLESLPATPTTT